MAGPFACQAVPHQRYQRVRDGGPVAGVTRARTAIEADLADCTARLWRGRRPAIAAVEYWRYPFAPPWSSPGASASRPSRFSRISTASSATSAAVSGVVTAVMAPVVTGAGVRTEA